MKVRLKSRILKLFICFSVFESGVFDHALLDEGVVHDCTTKTLMDIIGHKLMGQDTDSDQASALQTFSYDLNQDLPSLD